MATDCSHKAIREIIIRDAEGKIKDRRIECDDCNKALHDDPSAFENAGPAIGDLYSDLLTRNVPEKGRTLTYWERATWGECPICKAAQGELCDSKIGILLVRNTFGAQEGAHLGRLNRAPQQARLVGEG